jgi:hypothetical protein
MAVRVLHTSRLPLAANFWRHEIQECECFVSEDESDSDKTMHGMDVTPASEEMPFEVKELPGGGVMISMSAPLSEIFGGIVDEADADLPPAQ